MIFLEAQGFFLLFYASQLASSLNASYQLVKRVKRSKGHRGIPSGMKVVTFPSNRHMKGLAGYSVLHSMFTLLASME